MATRVRPTLPGVAGLPLEVPRLRSAGIRKLPTAAQAARAHLPGDASGAGKPAGAIPRAFLLRHRAAGAVGPTVPGYERPDWVLKIAKGRTSPERLLATLRTRVQRAPSEAALREAAMLLNDLGRLDDGGRLVRRHLTQEAVDAVLRQKGV